MNNPLKITLTYKAQFRLCHVSHLANKRAKSRKPLGAEKTKIITFIQSNFEQVIHEEKDSLDLCFERGEKFHIIGFIGQGDHYHIIAAILYISCAKGSYINWFAVSPLAYDSTRFEKHSNNIEE